MPIRVTYLFRAEGDTTAGINGVNALSTANAIAKVDSSVTQSNKNSLTASTQGGLGTLNLPVTINPGNNPHFNINIPLPVPAFIAQAQDVDQTNLNGQILIAASKLSLAMSMLVARATLMPALMASTRLPQQLPALRLTAR